MARRLPPRGQRAFELDGGRLYAYRYDDDAGEWVRSPAAGVEPAPGDRVLSVGRDGRARAERVGPRGGREAIPTTPAMRRAARALEAPSPARRPRPAAPAPAPAPAPRRRSRAVVPPPVSPAPPPAPPRAPRRPPSLDAAPTPEPRPRARPRAPERPPGPSGEVRRRLPPPGSRRFERDERTGRTYVYRYVTDRGPDGEPVRRAVLTPALGVEPGPGDRVLTVGLGGEVSAHEVADARGTVRDVAVTDGMLRAAERLEAGTGIVADLSRTRFGSRRSRAMVAELVRRAAAGGVELDPAAFPPELGAEVARIQAEARAAGVPARPMLRSPDRRRRRAPEEAGRHTSTFEDLGIAQADLAVRGQQRPGLDSAADYVVSQLARPVGRATIRVDDVYRTAGQRTLVRALEGDPTRGLRARLDPTRAYRVRVSFEVQPYNRSLPGQRFEAVAGDSTPAGMGLLVAWAIYNEVGPAGWLPSAGRRVPDVPQEAIDTLEATIEVFEL